MARNQGELPGVERKKVKAVEEAAESYVGVRDRRMALTTKEVEAKAALIAVMKEHKLDAYRYDDHVVLLTTKEGVKVKTDSEDADGGDED